MRKLIRLTESGLRNVIAETTRRVLMETKYSTKIKKNFKHNLRKGKCDDKLWQRGEDYVREVCKQFDNDESVRDALLNRLEYVRQNHTQLPSSTRNVEQWSTSARKYFLRNLKAGEYDYALWEHGEHFIKDTCSHFRDDEEFHKAFVQRLKYVKANYKTRAPKKSRASMERQRERETDPSGYPYGKKELYPFSDYE